MKMNLDHLFLVTLAVFTAHMNATGLNSGLNFGDLKAEMESKLTQGLRNSTEGVGQQIQDPLTIQDFNVSSSNLFTSVKAQFSNLTLSGMKNMSVEKVSLDLVGLSLKAEVLIPKLVLKGDYNLDGKLPLLTVAGNDVFNMDMNRLTISAATSLKMTNDQKRLEVDQMRIDLWTDNIKINFKNLGGQSYSSFYNSLLNTVSNLVFDELKFLMTKDMEKVVRLRLNKELAGLPETLVNDRSSVLIDDLLERSKEAIEDSIEPFILPNVSRSFSKQIFGVNLFGELHLFDGQLNGLTTLARTGKVLVEYQNESLIISANYGFTNLTSTYKWMAEFLGSSAIGDTLVSVKSISGFVQIKQNFKNETGLELKEFRIEDIRNILVEIKGLGAMDSLMEISINLVSNTFKKVLAKSVSMAVQEIVEEKLQEMKMTSGHTNVTNVPV